MSRAFLSGLLLTASLLLTARPAHADTTFTVNSTGDEPDTNPGDGVCDASPSVLNPCTLRAAIQEANATTGADTINFDILGGGVKTIAPTSALPLITDQVTIDGYTQPGASENTLDEGTNADLMIELDGTNGGGTGLSIKASNTVVKGLIINRFTGNGLIIDTSAPGTRVEGDFIGTDALGTQDLGNGLNGVLAQGANNTVGGTSPEARNLISGNGGGGIIISGSLTTSNKVEGNLIGTQKDGSSVLGNSGSGVGIINGASGNTVGGTGAANTIAFNSLNGVTVVLISTRNNSILGNSVFSNGGLGIDLGADGRSPNDPKDTDVGPNNLQNFPVITHATTRSSGTTIKGKLNSTPNTIFTVQFFSNPSDSKDEGKTLIGQKADVTTDGEGNATFVFIPAQKVPRGQFITATATDPDGNTSEFSAPRKVRRP